MTPAATETKRPIAHRCCHNHDSGIVASPSDRKTPSAVLSFTAETNFTIKTHQQHAFEEFSIPSRLCEETIAETFKRK
jgi:hypothetical protein